MLPPSLLKLSLAMVMGQDQGWREPSLLNSLTAVLAARVNKMGKRMGGTSAERLKLKT